MKTTFKRIVSIMLAVVMVFGAAPFAGFVGHELPEFNLFTTEAEAASYSGTCGTNLTWSLNTDTYVLEISGTGAMEDYSYSSVPWYSYRSNIKSVNISNSVTSIGNRAFYSCGSLTNVTIPNSVTTIGDEAFMYCNSFTDVAIPDSVTHIGDGAFCWCDSLTSVTIGDSVTSIGEHAFHNCDSLTNVTIGDSVTTIGDEAFYSCDSLTNITVDANNEYYSSDGSGVLFDKTKTTLIHYLSGNERTSYTVPGSVTTIGDLAFDDCDSLTSVAIPDSVTIIGDGAFHYCYHLTSITLDVNNEYYSSDSLGVLFDKAKTTLIKYPNANERTSYTIPDGVTTIRDKAFYSCDSLTSVTIPDSVTTIGEDAFQYCTSLTRITIPDSVTTISEDAFYNCYNLTSIKIGGRVNTIADSAFDACFSLTSIKVNSNNKYYSSDSYGVLFNKDKTKLLQYPIGNTRTSYTIPESVTTIGDGAFAEGDNLTNVTIPDSVTTIGDGAFKYCESLASVTIGDSVTTIGEYAFFSCNSVTSVTIPNSVKTIGDLAFNWCDNLTDVYYSGSKQEWNKIRIGSWNWGLTYATIHYNYVSPGSGDGAESAAEIKIGLNKNTIGENITCSEDDGTVDAVIAYITDNNYDISSLQITSSNPDVIEICEVTKGYIWYITEDIPDECQGKIQLNIKSSGTSTITVTTPEGVSESININVSPGYGTNVNKKTIVGIFQSQTLIVGDDWTSEITIDGKSYLLDTDYAHKLDLTNSENLYKNKQVAAVISDDKVIWLGTIDDIKCGLGCSVKLSHDSLAYAYNRYTTDTIKAYIYVSSTNLSGFCGDATVLANIPELKTYISSIKVTSSNPDLMNFNGKSSTVIDFGLNPLLINFGTSWSVATIEINVEQSYKLNPDKDQEAVAITCDVEGELKDQSITGSGINSVLIDNVQKDKPAVPNEGTDQSNLQQAAEALENAMENSAVTLDADISGTLNKLFTSQQLDAIGAQILSEVAMASAPKETFEETLSDKIISKVFNINTNWFGVVENGSIAVTNVCDTKYGEIEVKFTCDYYNYSIGGEKYAFKGDIGYEIVGGKGVKNLPNTFQSSGLAGALVGADVEAFCEAAWSVANDMLKESYDLAWGNDANTAADIIFGKSVNKILDKTKYGNVSGLVWEMLITPAKKVKIECPVDIFIYNSNDELVAAVENNTVTKTSENAVITVEGDIKTVWLFDDSYYIVYKSLAEYDMTITVEEYGYSDSHLRTSVIEDIPLEVGVNFTQNIDDSFLEGADYSVVSDSDEKYSVISDKTMLHNHQTNQEMELITDATCSNYGIKCAACSICNEWYKEIIPQIGHIDKDNNDECDECGQKILRVEFAEPSTTTISYGDSIVLHADLTEALPDGWYIEWTASNGNFSYEVSEDGTTCTISPSSSGDTTFTATVYDADRNAISEDTQVMKSKAGFFDKLIAFFKKLFGLTKVITQSLYTIY